MSDVVIKKDDSDFIISHIDEFVRFNLNIDQEYSNSPTINPKEEDIVIKGKFIIAIINYELLNEMSIPSIFVQVVLPEKWIKN
jgi:hypothetical protein